MFEMTLADWPPDTGRPVEIKGDRLGYFIDFKVGTCRPIGFEVGPSVRIAYLVEGVGALARLNLRPLTPDVWQAKLHWGPRGARQHMKFRVLGAMRWVADPAEYTWQGRAKRK